MNQIQTAGSTMMAALASFFNFLPTLIGAVIILILGWVVGTLLAKIVEKVLVAVGFERAVHNTGIAHFVEGAAGKLTVSKIVGELAKWFVFLLFVQAAANLLNMPQITAVMNSILLFIPKLIVAVAIVVLGSVIAQFLSGLVERTITQAGAGNAKLLASFTNYAVIGFAVIAALDQIGIATTVVDTLLIGLVGSVALGVGLAFGLGGREVAGKITASWYEGGQGMAENLKKTQTPELAPKARVYAAQ